MIDLVLLFTISILGYMNFLKVLLSVSYKKPFVKMFGGLITVFLLSSCDTSHKQVPIHFNLIFDDKSFDCSSLMDVKEGRWKLDQLQFFISKFRLKDSTGHWFHASLVNNKSNKSKPRSKEVALVGVVCSDSGTWKIDLETQLNTKDITGLAFTLGVPFELNHQNPMSLPAPLNQPDMFWTWQSGHKFLRLEMHSEDKEFVYHLGSTGCVSSSPVRSPQTECKNPNRVEVTLDDYNPSKTVSLDLSSLLKGSKLDQDISCQSSPDNSQCLPLFMQTGVSSEQQFFRIVN